ncbi:hypothetical protein Pelo_10902 [Pelomyxa schiedti]|nr:hypothetical protein Pelo_10902 [Pelomyxa schiedti]
MGRDARGFERCACLKERCDCKEFEANHEGRCFYCGHFPSRHTNLTTQAISTAPSTSTSASCSMSAPPPTLATEIARVSKLLAALEPIEPSRVSDAIQTLQKFPDTIFHVSRLASYSNAGQALDELSPIVRPLPVVSTRFATHPCQAVNPRVEGVRTSDIILSRREHKVQQLVSNAFKNGAILVIGPPFCGKTSLAMTLIGSQITNIPIFSTTMLRDGCDNFWSDTNTFLRRRQGLFVMDEVQKAYFSDQSEFMWQTAKSLILEPTPNFAMLLFAVHATPLCFPPSVSLGFLCFSKEELEEIRLRINSYLESTQSTAGRYFLITSFREGHSNSNGDQIAQERVLIDEMLKQSGASRIKAMKTQSQHRSCDFCLTLIANCYWLMLYHGDKCPYPVACSSLFDYVLESLKIISWKELHYSVGSLSSPHPKEEK